MDKEQHQIDPLSHQESEEMWQNVISRIRVQEAKKRKNELALYSAIMTTAAILIVGSIILFNLTTTPKVYYAKDRKLELLLKEGTQVNLQPGAKLTVEADFPSKTRDVILEGNATFKVTKSNEHPFIVHTKNYETKVLGTTFNVTQRGNTFKIDLYEGKVQVYKIGQPKEYFTLRPKETFSNLGSLQVATIRSQKKQNEKPTVSTATLSMTSIPLSEAVSIIENTYEIKIRFPKENTNSIITIIKENATGKDLIQLIAIQLNLNLKSINDQTFELED